MNRQLSRSLPAKLVAVSFIVLILLGNCWFVMTMIGQRPPAWFPIVSRMAFYCAVGGGLWLAVLAFNIWLHSEDD